MNDEKYDFGGIGWVIGLAGGGVGNGGGGNDSILYRSIYGLKCISFL